jgi:hypothetical protein
MQFTRAPLGGVRIVKDIHMTDVVEDWSRVRSPSRARRRLRYGHPQNVVFRNVPKKDVFYLEGGNVIVGHPETIAELERLMAAQSAKVADRMMNEAFGLSSQVSRPHEGGRS